jgi:hypothetical protein
MTQTPLGKYLEDRIGGVLNGFGFVDGKIVKLISEHIEELF